MRFCVEFTVFHVLFLFSECRVPGFVFFPLGFEAIAATECKSHSQLLIDTHSGQYVYVPRSGSVVPHHAQVASIEP
mgnify:CR=1 FL=1